jgi:hypothetical protein
LSVRAALVKRKEKKQNKMIHKNKAAESVDWGMKRIKGNKFVKKS